MKKTVFILSVFLSIFIFSCEDNDNNTTNTNINTDYPNSELYGTYFLNDNTGYDEFNYNYGASFVFRTFKENYFCIWGFIGPSIRSYAEMYKRGDYYYELSSHGIPLRQIGLMKGNFRYDSISYYSKYDFIGIYSSDTNFNDTLGTFYFKQINRDTMNLK